MVKIVCHKGANELCPENTMASSRLCVDWGVDYVEVDVNTSADGVMYILHGPRVNGTTNGSGYFCNLTSAEIDALDAGSWFSSAFAGERVPRLDSFLRWIKDKAKVFLDVKRADHKALISLIYEVGMEDDVFFWSDVKGWQRMLLDMDPKLKQKLNISSGILKDSMVQQLDALKGVYGASLFCVEVSLRDFSPELRDQCHERGVLCMVLHCKKDAKGFAKIIRDGADMVNLDHADLFLKVMHNKDMISIDQEPRVAETPLMPREAPEQHTKEFYLFSIAFGLNHATVTTPILFASSVLTNEAGQGANAVLYGSCLLSSLFLSNPLCGILGPKKGLSLAMGLYSVYVLSFAFAASQCIERDEDETCKEAGSAQLPFALIGGLVGGTGAGILWTCQGAYVSKLCENISQEEGRLYAEVSSQVFARFGRIFLANECAIRFLTTVLNKYAKFSFHVTFYIWSALAFLATFTYMFFANNAGNTRPRFNITDKVFSVVSLWRDPKLWLLQGINITFAFAAAWLAGYVGREIFSSALSAGFVGFAGAILSGIAAILSTVFGKLATNIGKGPVLSVGAVAFICLGVFSKFGNPAGWGWATFIFYVFMSIGRAVYESTNKALFSDSFRGDESAAAFSNVFVFNSASSCIAFICGANDIETPELVLLLLFAFLIMPGYLAARYLDNQPPVMQQISLTARDDDQ